MTKIYQRFKSRAIYWDGKWKQKLIKMTLARVKNKNKSKYTSVALDYINQGLSPVNLVCFLGHYMLL